MDTNTAHCLRPAFSVAELSDGELLAGTRRLVGRSNETLAELLAHLGEVEARGIHRTRACSSLYVYCIYELRLSEDEAYRRVTAARLVRRFPGLFDAVASGELHLTGLLMLGPHLNVGNLAEVLARAKHRTKREVARLVRLLDPLSAVPARIEPLGPAPSPHVVVANPTWEVFVQSSCPVRDLAPGERPRDWSNEANERFDGTPANNDPCAEHAERPPVSAPARNDMPLSGGLAGRAASAPVRNGEPPSEALGEEGRSVSAPARNDTALSEGLAPERYKVQFTASEEYVELIDEAKALLSHAAPRATLEEIHLRAMQALVAALKKRKYAAKEDAAPVPAPARQSKGVPAFPRQRGRYIPARVRRAVVERDGGRCTYVDALGERCLETHRVEFHHLEPFAKGGEHETTNITLRCASHNALAADQDFGRDFMQEKRLPTSHEPIGGGLPSG